MFIFLSLGLEITYTIDLDRIKAESGSNLFRRMFFVDEATKNKVFSISSIHNLTKQGESHCSAPRTVYLKVCYINYIGASNKTTHDVRSVHLGPVSLRIRDGPLEKFGGRGGKYKKNSCKGKLREKKFMHSE